MSHTSSHLTRRTVLIAATALSAAGTAAMSDPYAASRWRLLSDADWRRRLPSTTYEILRHEATEAPFTSPLNEEHRTGTFVCGGCGLPLFKSQWKFNSGTGWPSFYTAIPGAIAKKKDFALVLERTEYHCSQCLGHQGHVFDDGPPPTGLRHCNNGAALKFIPV